MKESEELEAKECLVVNDAVVDNNVRGGRMKYLETMRDVTAVNIDIGAVVVVVVVVVGRIAKNN